MRLVKNKKNQKRYLRLFKLINATNQNDGQVMYLYLGPHKDKHGWGLFVREINEFENKFC